MVNQTGQAATPQPMPDPQALQPSGLSNKHKRWMFYGIMTIVGLVVLANIVGSPPRTATKQPTSAAALQQNPSPQQIREMAENLGREQQQLQQANEDAKRRIAQQPMTAADLQNQAALQEAQQMHQQYAGGQQSGGTDQAAQMRQEREQRAYKALFADNVIRQQGQTVSFTPPIAPQEKATEQQPEPSIKPVSEKERKALDFDPAAQTNYWLPEGTVMEAVLTNRLDGDAVGPVNCMITTDVYLPGTRLVVVPQGARVLGEASKVASLGQQRLAVSFHRVIVPGLHSYSIPLDKEPPALAQAGEVGLKDKTNNHYASIFGASLAIGAIGGLAQIGNSVSSFGYDPSSQFRSGVSQSMAQSSERVLDRFLNKLPTLTIREGTRVKILLADDLRVPGFDSMHTQGGF